MTRNILVLIGSVLLSIGAIGITVGLVWITASRLNGAVPYILDARAETVLYALPALLLTVAIVGACFVASALAIPLKKGRNQRTLRPHARFHA